MQKNEAKAVVQSALETLDAALRQGKSESLRAYLRAMGRFSNYSLRNILLIAEQRPGSAHVAGFRAWHRLGRRVRKGERGIAILAPLVRRANPNGERPDEQEENEGAGERDAADESVFGFKVVHVFDISQTEGKPLPEFARAQGEPGDCLARLKELAESQRISIEYAESLGGADGVSRGGSIVIRKGLSPAEECSVVAHEIAHELMHKDSEKRAKSVLETEAEAVAFVVCEAMGLESRVASADYIQLHQGDTQLLAASLERIRSTASRLIEVLTAEKGDKWVEVDPVPTRAAA